MRAWVPPLIWTAMLCGIASAQGVDPKGRVIDRAVASIDGRVITLSELDFEARVALIQMGGTKAAGGSLDDEALRSALDLAVGERLETNEADKLQAYPLDEGEVEAALQRFERRFSSHRELEEFLARHDCDRNQLAALLARSLRASKVLEGKVKLRAQVSEAEVKRFYEAHRLELGPSFDQARAAVRQKMSAERLRQLILEELIQARKAADVRLIAPFLRKGGA